MGFWRLPKPLDKLASFASDSPGQDSSEARPQTAESASPTPASRVLVTPKPRIARATVVLDLTSQSIPPLHRDCDGHSYCCAIIIRASLAPERIYVTDLSIGIQPIRRAERLTPHLSPLRINRQYGGLSFCAYPLSTVRLCPTRFVPGYHGCHPNASTESSWMPSTSSRVR